MSPSAADSSTRLARLRLDEIRVYERNPRRTVNPEYDRIKQSIRAHGLEQPLIVAESQAGYVVCAGGNTRLSILKELQAETGEDRFASVECLVRPWESDAATLIAHLRENELRGALSFIDRARAIVEVQRLLTTTSGKPLSQRQLAAQLTEDGYAVSQSLISSMVYAVETLDPLLPTACAAGLGRRPVERIRTLERAAAAVWRHHRLGTKAEFQETFAALCQRSDGPDWSFEAFRGSLELEIATAADARIHTIRLALDQALEGAPAVQGRDGGSEDPPREGETPATPAHAAAPKPGVGPDPAPVAPEGSRTLTVEPASPVQSQPHPEDPATAPVELATVEALRARAWALAHRLAERYGLGALVVETPEVGLGFAVVEVPDESLIQGLDPELLGRVSLLWWHLVAAAELMVAAPAQASVSSRSTLGDVLAARDAEALFDRVWTPDPGQVGDLLWRALPEPDWEDFVGLMATYRRLHAVAQSRGESLWPSGDVSTKTGG